MDLTAPAFHCIVIFNVRSFKTFLPKSYFFIHVCSSSISTCLHGLRVPALPVQQHWMGKLTLRQHRRSPARKGFVAHRREVQYIFLLALKQQLLAHLFTPPCQCERLFCCVHGRRSSWLQLRDASEPRATQTHAKVPDTFITLQQK